jgi:hypothetical protein
VNEGDNGTNQIDYKVVLSAPSGRTVSVPIQLSGTANSSDYSVRSGDLPVVFAPGTTVRTIQLRINGDNAHEGDDTIVMTLSSGGLQNATIGSPSSRTHTITNDD